MNVRIAFSSPILCHAYIISYENKLLIEKKSILPGTCTSQFLVSRPEHKCEMICTGCRSSWFGMISFGFATYT